MTAQECQAGLEAGREPLELAIEKFETLADHFVAGEMLALNPHYPEADNCSLCLAFATITNDGSVDDCRKCPLALAKDTGIPGQKPCCLDEGSWYDSIVDAIHAHNMVGEDIVSLEEVCKGFVKLLKELA